MQNIKIPSQEKLIEMLIEEEEIRLSDTYKNECTKVKDVPDGWLTYTSQMQVDLVKRHGFNESQMVVDIAVNMLGTAQYLYPDDDRFKTIPLYVRNNRAKQGLLKIGDQMPNMHIYDFNQNPVMLHDLLSTNKLNIVIGSSSS